MEKTPLVSVIIANWNGKTHLEKCLSSIGAQSHPNIETILIDNASSDGSVDYVRKEFPSVHIIENEINRGFCGANNQGIAAAKGEFVFLLNNDTAIAPDCISEMLAVLEKEDDSSLGCFPKVVFYSDPHLINSLGTQWHKKCHWRDARVGRIDLGQFKESERVFGSIFPAVLLRRDAFERIGMFDETMFSYCEDFDVCYRANMLGYQFVTAPNAVVRHKYRSTAASAFRERWQHYFFMRNYLYVFLKNYSLKSLIRHFPYAFYRYCGKSAIAALKRRDVKDFAMHVRAVAFVVGKLPSLMRNRRFVQSNRKRQDEEIWSDANVEHYNIFHHFGRPVLSVLNIRTGLSDLTSYTINSEEYQIE
ncbi:MAG: glycosyltransferase family 2 protein [Candidatus Coatesbacteria bacterium]|nr:glycosyltransferase family 2 protein [Candidatus Coatesbacteria bacterium]